ncbi:hypothetical protein ACI6PS_00985 [Flavobacterium sp. PLA-1-15]|uniref:hypothetical protein n=1 Tax=Flavobacterium sp. PLA-1-15 TaxID=3380533 RepID=UPI003B7BF302
MASETGHYKNVANGLLLIERIETFPSEYKPSKKKITLVELKDYHEKGNNYITEVQQAKGNWSLIVDGRQQGFRGIKKFSTRIMGILSGTNMTKKEIETARAINVKIQGVKLIKPKEVDIEKEANEPEAKKHSASRQSYDSLYENFSDLIELLTICQGYDPVVDEFKIVSLKGYAKGLLDYNSQMAQAEAKITDIREKRNVFMYTPETGYVDVMLDAKSFIKGLFGADSEKFKNINKISFRNIR